LAGTDKLKEALAALGLKTGGTPQQRVERLWLTKHTPLDKLERKHFSKSSATAKTPAEAAKIRANAKSIALLESKVRLPTPPPPPPPSIIAFDREVGRCSGGVNSEEGRAGRGMGGVKESQGMPRRRNYIIPATSG
jgi:hypothetical protein